MRWTRKIFDVGLPITGMVLVFLAALWVQDLQLRVILILIGLLLIWVGVWKLANPLYPNERRFHDLRLEVDRFIALVRDLNQAALQQRVGTAQDSSDRYDSILSAMRRSVDRMAALAGREHAERELETDPDTVRPFQSSTSF
ncbi:MAG: hypothetical protein R3E10_05780 [Gemmatimonadota bacterium]